MLFFIAPLITFLLSVSTLSFDRVQFLLVHIYTFFFSD